MVSALILKLVALGGFDTQGQGSSGAGELGGRDIPPGKPTCPEQSLPGVPGQVDFSRFAEPLVPLSFCINQPLC